MTITARLPRKLTLDTFLAFYATRPDEEQWQLVDEVAILMTPPFLTHQRVAGNLQRLLNAALETHAPHLYAEQRIGIELPQFNHYRPEPDVAVMIWRSRRAVATSTASISST
ncbi:MAG: Uma2 family endonuclease [Pseudomonadota bacterium]|nr:Uma2 family endonuclease [Pseudomonadota bacterium]